MTAYSEFEKHGTVTITLVEAEMLPKDISPDTYMLECSECEFGGPIGIRDADLARKFAVAHAEDHRLPYKCSFCQIENVKLWRQAGVFAQNIRLKCLACIAHEDNTPVELAAHNVDSGEVKFGFLVPAYPTEAGETYWGLTSVPESVLQSWKDLRTI